VAGCGGSSHNPPVAALASTPSAAATGAATSSRRSAAIGNRAAHSGPPTQASLEADALVYAQCMRAHGVPSFPDPPNPPPTPSATAPGTETYLGNGPNPDSPTVRAGAQACRRYAVASPVSPAVQAQVQSQQLDYAHCMRAHRVPDFPDPSSTGGFALPRSVDENSPIFQSAERACRSLERLPPALPRSGGG